LCSVVSIYCVLLFQFILFCRFHSLSCCFHLLCSAVSIYCVLLFPFILSCCFNLLCFGVFSHSLCSVVSIYLVLLFTFIAFYSAPFGAS
jgi:hypothetical protein